MERGCRVFNEKNIDGVRSKDHNIMSATIQKFALVLLTVSIFSFQLSSPAWESKFIKINKDGSLKYFPDEKGNIIPDFSRVGYYSGNKTIPDVPVVKTIEPAANGTSEAIIQSAIDEVSKRTPDKDGFRGTILLKKGTYKIPEDIHIETSGIVLRGEGDNI